jgi:hypothetical protein
MSVKTLAATLRRKSIPFPWIAPLGVKVAAIAWQLMENKTIEKLKSTVELLQINYML